MVSAARHLTILDQFFLKCCHSHIYFCKNAFHSKEVILIVVAESSCFRAWNILYTTFHTHTHTEQATAYQ